MREIIDRPLRGRRILVCGKGLIRLLFGLGVEGEPRPLVEFFGGINAVTCPVDDPSPLTRVAAHGAARWPRAGL